MSLITNLNIKLQYKFHLLLNVKNKYLLIALIQLLFVLYLTNLYDHTYCMTTDSDNQSEVSDILEYSEDYLNDMFSQAFEITRDRAYSAFTPIPDAHLHNALGPMYTHYKNTLVHPEEVADVTSTQKIQLLEEDYFENYGKNVILEGLLEDQGAQLLRRHTSLLSAKNTIRDLTQENLQLKNEIDELQRQLSEILRK